MAGTHLEQAMLQPAAKEYEQEQEQEHKEEWEYNLRKYLLLLATVVATVTYSAGFNAPGGVWQESSGGHRSGDAIIPDIRYTFFFYCNAIAFASSLVVAVLILLIALVDQKNLFIKLVLLLRVVMVLDFISLVIAHTGGTSRNRFTKIYYSLQLAASVTAYLILQVVLASDSKDPGTNSDVLDSKALDENSNNEKMKKQRKVLMLLTTFVVSLTYFAGLNTPRGFWDNAKGSHHPGDTILMEHHGIRLTAFFICNTTAFAVSLFMIVLLFDKKLRTFVYMLNGCIVVALISLIGAYAAGSSRQTGTTTYIVSLGIALLSSIALLVIIAKRWYISDQNQPEATMEKQRDDAQDRWSCSWSWPECFKKQSDGDARVEQHDDALDKARSLVLLLAILVATITYQAGLDPPGGVWQENGDGHVAGDPVLQTTNPRRYKVFFYCNSVAFVASLVVIVLVQRKLLLRHHVLEAVMFLDLFSLIGAYAAGTCRDVNTSIYAIAMAIGVLVYAVIHVLFFTLDQHKGHDVQVEKRRKRLLLFAILAATITYQAGMTPPGGFLLRDDETTGHHAGDPILLYNSTHHHTAFFYCNSASFMLSTALILLLVNPNLYRLAVQSYALSVCTAADLFGLAGAYAIGSTQGWSTSISIASVPLLVLFLLLIMFLAYELGNKKSAGEASQEAEPLAQDQKDPDLKKRKYLMLLGILVASVTYQAGLDQPGGVWQSTAAYGHVAGNPVMQDSRYQSFFYFNSTAFVGSIAVIVLLLPGFEVRKDCWFRLLSTTVLMDLLLLLAAYTVGSTRDWKTSAYVAALITAAVLAYTVVHVMLSHLHLLSIVSRPNRTGSVTPSAEGNAYCTRNYIVL